MKYLGTYIIYQNGILKNQLIMQQTCVQVTKWVLKDF